MAARWWGITGAVFLLVGGAAQAWFAPQIRRWNERMMPRFLAELVDPVLAEQSARVGGVAVALIAAYLLVRGFVLE